MQSSSKSPTTKTMKAQPGNQNDDQKVTKTDKPSVPPNDKSKAVTNSPQNKQSSEVIKDKGQLYRGHYTVPPNAKRPLSESASLEPKRTRTDDKVPPSEPPNCGPRPGSSSPAPSNEKIKPGSEKIVTPTRIPHQSIDSPQKKQSNEGIKDKGQLYRGRYTVPSNEKSLPTFPAPKPEPLPAPVPPKTPASPGIANPAPSSPVPSNEKRKPVSPEKEMTPVQSPHQSVNSPPKKKLKEETDDKETLYRGHYTVPKPKPKK